MKRILTLLALVAICICSYAYDFEEDGIYYSITSSTEKTVRVTYRDYFNNTSAYSGSVVIPSDVTNNGTTYSVTSIGDEAFFGCTSLTSVTIPSSVTIIGTNLFQSCSGLTSIMVEDGNPNYDSRNNCNAIIETRTNTLKSGCKNTLIPNSVTRIGDYTFSSCSGLTSVTIPNSVTSIGEWAFLGCSGLTSITIPNSVTSIGTGAFYGCSGLSSVTIGNSLANVGRDAFNKCNNVRELIYSEGCTTTIRTGLTSITSVTIPNSVTSIGASAFYGCSGLTSVTIPNFVTSIEASAFSGCSGLTSINIPSTVTNIGDYAFSGCSGLTSINIPSTVTNIRDYAFKNCKGLKEIHSQSVLPPSAGASSFENVSTNYCKLYVPIGTREDYAFAQGWLVFANIIEEKVISGDDENKCAAPTIEYVDGHLKFNSETPNATFSYTITDDDIKTSLEDCENGDVSLSATYNIIVYAFADGYGASDATTATLHWIDGTIDSIDGLKTINSKRGILVSCRNGFVTITGLKEGEKVDAYTIDGKYISSVFATSHAANLSAQLGDVVVLKIGKDSIKTIVK